MSDSHPVRASASLHRTLGQLAALARIRGDAREAALFADAAALVDSHRITSDADLGPLLESPPHGAGPEVLTRLHYMYDAGGWVLLESAIADLPADLRWLFESNAVTIEQLAALHEARGVTSAADLRAEVARGTIRAMPALGPQAEAAIEAALPTLRAALPRLTLGRAYAVADPVIQVLRETPGTTMVEPVGSMRRGEDIVGDIELVAPASDPAPAFERLRSLPDLARCLHQSERRLYVLLDRVQVGVRSPAPDAAGAALCYYTGSRSHVDALQVIASGRGWTLGPEGVMRGGNRPPVAATEEDIYDVLGLPFIPPELRDGDEAIAVARDGGLPTLVHHADVRGDLHMHSNYSDGRDSVETMVQGCIALGYEYLAITDHSPHSVPSRALTPDSIARQAEEIAGLRARYPKIAILHGCEVDILRDGRLDFPDRILERFDIVLASLHDGGGDSPQRLLQRYAGAMRHPLVSIITHPTNRLVPTRAGYGLDYGRLFSLAAETGTVLEIDGAPGHLDLDGPLARLAIAAGVTVSIDSDCHRVDMLGRQMHLGLTMARRGWVEPRHVLNTRSVADVRAQIAAKRRGQAG